MDVSQSNGVVKRVFGSASGISGPAADGTTIDKMLLNRYISCSFRLISNRYLLLIDVDIEY